MFKRKKLSGPKKIILLLMIIFISGFALYTRNRGYPQADIVTVIFFLIIIIVSFWKIKKWIAEIELEGIELEQQKSKIITKFFEQDNFLKQKIFFYNGLMNFLFLFSAVFTLITVMWMIQSFEQTRIFVKILSIELFILTLLMSWLSTSLSKNLSITNQCLVNYYLKYQKSTSYKKYKSFVTEKILPLLEKSASNEAENENDETIIRYTVTYFRMIILNLDLKKKEFIRIINELKGVIKNYDYNKLTYLLNKIDLHLQRRKDYKALKVFLKSKYPEMNDENVFTISKNLSEPSFLQKILKKFPSIIEYIEKNRFVVILLIVIISIILKESGKIDFLKYLTPLVEFLE